MTKFKTILILLLVPAIMASCAPTNPGCAGWQRVHGDAASVDWLAANDPQMLRDVLGNYEFGVAQGCW